MVVGTNGYLWPFKPIGTNGPRNYYIKSKILAKKNLFAKRIIGAKKCDLIY